MHLTQTTVLVLIGKTKINKTMVLYIIISIVIIAVSFFCLRSKFQSYVPVCIISFIPSAVICSIIETVRFLNIPDNEKTSYVNEFYETESNTLDLSEKYPIKVDSEYKNRFTKKDLDSLEIIYNKGNVSGILTVVKKTNYDLGLLWEIGYSDAVEYKLVLCKKDYEIYKASIDTTKERTCTLDSIR